MGAFTNTNQLMPYTEIIVVLRKTPNIYTKSVVPGGVYSKHDHLSFDSKAVHWYLFIVRVQADILWVAGILLILHAIECRFV
jgi:hypothetical protein